MQAKTLKSVLKDFAEWTSIPGPIQIVYALNSFTRFLWVVIWLNLFGIFVYQFYLIVDKCLKFPSEVHQALSFDNPKRLPTITFCNLNPYKYDSIRTNSNFSELKLLIEEYEHAVSGGISHVIGTDHFGLNHVSSLYEKERWTKKALQLLANGIPEQVREQATYRFEELVKSCHFNGIPCNRMNFTTYMDSGYGACYRFNPSNHSGFYTYQSGNLFGLRLMLTVSQYHPLNSQKLYLPTTEIAGIRLVVNADDREELAMESLGMNFGVGHEWAISMENSKSRLLKQPYGQCVEKMNSSMNFYKNYKYDISNCLRSCEQRAIIRECGCADPSFHKPESATFCDASKETIDCLINIDSKLPNFSPLKNCSCFPACQKESFELSTSSTIFPSPSFYVNPDQSGESMPVGCDTFGSPFYGNLQRCVQWHQRNSLILNIFYRGLEFVDNEEKASYTLVKASNDLGGQMGLWLGVSVISIFELLALLFMVVLYFLQEKSVRVVPYVEEYEADPRYRVRLSWPLGAAKVWSRYNRPSN